VESSGDMQFLLSVLEKVVEWVVENKIVGLELGNYVC
jgi:hypothetical protein